MKDYPFIRVTTAFIVGILSSTLYKIDFMFIVIAAIITLASFLYFVKKKGFKKYALLFSSCLLAIFVGIGNIVAQFNTNHFNNKISELYREKNVRVIGYIENIELIRDTEIQFYVSSEIFDYGDTKILDKVLLLCKLRVSSSELKTFYDSVKPGNKIELRGTYTKARERRNPGEFDYDKYLKSKGITGIFTLNQDDDYKLLDHSVYSVSNTIFQARKFIDRKISSLHSEQTAALLRGLLLADRREIDQDTKTQFINSGVIHVLAVSGLHVGFIAFIFYFILGRLNIYTRSILTIAGLLCFMFITGIPPSVFRATVMAVVIIIAFMYNRSTNIFNSLAIAAFIILLINPAEIYSPGFLLSFSAVLAIGIFYPPLSAEVKRLKIKNKFFRYILLFICVSLAAQIGTLPFVLIYFGKISIIGLIANLVVIPAIGLIISLAVTTILISTIFPFIAAYYSALNDLLCDLLLKLIAFSGDLSFSSIDVVGFTFFDTIIFYISLSIMMIVLSRFKNTLAKITLVCLIIMNFLIYTSLDNNKLLPDNQLSVFMIDVGQGDSFLIKFPDGETGLIDAGNASIFFDNGEKVILQLLKYLGVDKIDYGFISHMDTDHYGGFFSIVQSGKIKQIYKPLVDSTLTKDIKFENFLGRSAVQIHNYRNQLLKIGNSRIYILTDDDLSARNNFSLNDGSGILKLVCGKSSFIFTGDAGVRSEQILINKYSTFLNSDVLKAGHHGSKTSTSQEFIKFTSPQYALISAGILNKFGHPSSEVISRLNSGGVEQLRTDKQGGILLVSDGKKINVKQWD